MTSAVHLDALSPGYLPGSLHFAGDHHLVRLFLGRRSADKDLFAELVDKGNEIERAHRIFPF